MFWIDLRLIKIYLSQINNQLYSHVMWILLFKQDKWKTLVHTAGISPHQRRGEPVPQDLLDRVLAAHSYWSLHQSKQQGKQLIEPLKTVDPNKETVGA